MTLSATAATLRAAGCVFAEEEAALLHAAAEDTAELTELTMRRASGEPLEHVIGWAEFGGLRISMTPGVFVPRRRTGLLVGQVVRLAAERSVVIDMCCGSGAIGAAVLASRPSVDLHAVDIDHLATACARRNIGSSGQVHDGDLYDALPGELRHRVDIVVANAPYVPSEAIAYMPPEARLYEPLIALDGGADGLDVLRRVVAGAREWLDAGGHLLFETGHRQADAAADLAANAGLVPHIVSADEEGGTVIVAKMVKHNDS